MRAQKELWRVVKEDEKKEGKIFASFAHPTDGFYSLEPLIQGKHYMAISDRRGLSTINHLLSFVSILVSQYCVHDSDLYEILPLNEAGPNFSEMPALPEQI